MPAPRRRTPSWLLVVTGIAGAALAGAGTWLLVRPDPGWFASAPLSGSTYRPADPDGLALALLGAGLALVGAAVVAGIVRRRRDPGER